MHKIIENAKKLGRNLLEPEAMELFKEYQIPVPAYSLVYSAEEAAAASEKIGFPVVMKIVSKDVIHKTDAGGVRVGVANAEDAGRAYEDIISAVKTSCPRAEITGILVVKQLNPGLECIVGVSRDKQLGAAVMFGLGGVFVELLKDVSFQLLPISQREADEMITSIKAAPLLTGYRGKAPKDTVAVRELILKVAKLVEENPEIAELDINPVMVYENGLIALDARIIL